MKFELGGLGEQLDEEEEKENKKKFDIFEALCWGGIIGAIASPFIKK